LQTAPSGQVSIHFNVGHTEDMVVAAFSDEEPVGIDVEPQDRTVETAALAQRVLTASERERWQSHPASRRREAFLHIWTCKEAFLKATGEGLNRPPKSIECTFDGPKVTGLREAPEHQHTSASASTGQWTVNPFSAADGVVGALVRKGDVPTSLSWIDAAPLINQASF
jgi:4'-phosphopantetheinyl transferase